jgi:hypothetical protein
MLLDMCGEGHVQGTPLALSLMPISYVVMLAGLANYSKGYVGKIIENGASIKDLKRLLLGAVVAGGSTYSSEGKYCVRFYAKIRPARGSSPTQLWVYMSGRREVK